MRTERFSFRASDGKELAVHAFLPKDKARAVVHIAHGMAEHGARYGRVAEALTASGYAVYANDHRGHGQTATEAELGTFGPGGFDRAVLDLVELVARARREHPGLPLALFGHSMGSYMVQAFLLEHGDAIDAAVLSGSAGKPSLLASAGRLIARAERLRVGGSGTSKLIDGMSFGAFNKAFAPNRTEADWLSRDEAEVDKYIADPRCGFSCSTDLWVEVLDALASIAEPARQAQIPKELPVYVFAGSRDPVGENTKSLDQLLGAYRRAGLRRLTHKFYPEGRHEMLNETNRDEVTRDLVAWLDASTKGPLADPASIER